MRETTDNTSVGFGQAVYRFYANYFNIRGVASQSEFNWGVLFVVLGTMASIIAALYISIGCDMPLRFGFLSVLPTQLCGFVIPFFSLIVRRLHDAGGSAKIVMLLVALEALRYFEGGFLERPFFVEYICIIVVLHGCLSGSKMEDNPYRTGLRF